MQNPVTDTTVNDSETLLRDLIIDFTPELIELFRREALQSFVGLYEQSTVGKTVVVSLHHVDQHERALFLDRFLMQTANPIIIRLEMASQAIDAFSQAEQLLKIILDRLVLQEGSEIEDLSDALMKKKVLGHQIRRIDERYKLLFPCAHVNHNVDYHELLSEVTELLRCTANLGPVLYLEIDEAQSLSPFYARVLESIAQGSTPCHLFCVLCISTVNDQQVASSYLQRIIAHTLSVSTPSSWLVHQDFTFDHFDRQSIQKVLFAIESQEAFFGLENVNRLSHECWKLSEVTTLYKSSAHIQNMTHGIPHEVIRYMGYLLSSRSLYFDFEMKCWRAIAKQLWSRSMLVADDFMFASLENFHSEDQIQVLKFLSTAGYQVNRSVLVQYLGRFTQDINALLCVLVSSQLCFTNRIGVEDDLFSIQPKLGASLLESLGKPELDKLHLAHMKLIFSQAKKGCIDWAYEACGHQVYWAYGHDLVDFKILIRAQLIAGSYAQAAKRKSLAAKFFSPGNP